MRLLPLLVCAAALQAQDAAGPLRFVPADCEIVLRTRGPAAWKREFATTSLGRAIAGPELLPKWKKLVTLLAVEGEAVRQRIGELPDAFGEYAGEIAVGFRVDWEATDFDAGRPAGSLILTMAPGPSTDLEDLEELGERIAETLPETGDVEIALGAQTALVRRTGDWQLAGPVMCDGRLVLVAGTDLERQARAFFEVGEHQRFEPEGDFGEVTLGVRIAVDRILAQVAAKAEEAGEARIVGLIKELGFGAISALSLTMFPDGRYVGQTVVVDFQGPERGLIGVGLPARRGRPTLLRYLPPAAQTWSVGPLDGAGLVAFYLRLFEALGDGLPVTREEVERQFTAYTRLRLVEDVLALVGDEYLRIDDMAAAIEYDEDMSEAEEKVQDSLANTCFVLQMRDGKAFGKNLDTAIRARGLHVGRKSEPYADTRIYRMNLLGMFPIEYAVTDSLFVLGIGDSEGTRQNVRGVLDRVAAGATEPAEFPPAVRQRLEGLPADWSGIGVASVTELLDGMLTSLAEWEAWLVEEDLAPEDVEDPWWAMLDLAKALRPELLRHGAAISVTTDYFGNNRFLSRWRW